MKPILMLVTLMILWSAAEILLKYGISQTGELDLSLTALWRVAWNPWVVSSVFISGSAFILWIGVLMRMELGFAWYLTSLMYFFILIGARLFLNEPVTPLKVLGVALITVGVVCITMEQKTAGAPPPAHHSTRQLR